MTTATLSQERPPDASLADAPTADAPTADAPRAGAPVGVGRKRPPPLGPGPYLVRTVLVLVFVLAAAVVVHLALVSSLQQRSAQQRLLDQFRLQLAEGTAPVGPTDADGDVLPVGTPVAYLEVPGIGVKQVVVSGTSSGALFAGPGHRRDSVLPGQAGVSVIMGRNATYGAPFAGIDGLERGDRITITTGQGEFTYRVLGVRRPGDPIPAPPADDESRLVLTTADGAPYLPSGVVRVDAEMEGDAARGPGRLFPAEALPLAERTMAGDTGQLWALAFWLQALVLVAVGAVWSWHRWGHPQAWVAFLPPLLLLGIGTANQAARLLPNLL
ncbi:MAG: sortase [Actinomycetota bacterium]|nr:sortase [Actinomycetota bacterium]